MFQKVFESYSWEQVRDWLSEVDEEQVIRLLGKIESSLNSGQHNLNAREFLTLISPAAQSQLDWMANLSRLLTRKRFGNTIQLYAPVYLTNSCSNICTYCGFSYNNEMERIILKDEEADRELSYLKEQGYDHILVVTGEDSRKAGMDYFREMVPLFREHFSHLSLEVQPLDYEDYFELIELGLDSVLVYQETYHKDNYRIYHPKGKKSNFDYRMGTPDRLAQAKIHKIGLGVLLGLEDWRVDSFFCALHFDYLRSTYWQTKYSVSFPRLRPAVGVDFTETMKQKYLSDNDLAQLIFAYRLMDEDLEISLSTRESREFRDQIIPWGITTMSAGSKTNPGGYVCYPETSLEQFEIDDDRPLADIKAMLEEQGLEPVVKDWSRDFHTPISSPTVV